uniref:Putative tm816 triabin-like lipocalin n=1 Tax=Panstrongylus megistus TaxID=65343 RepID=A0A069DPF1_9HEMI
MKTIFVVTFFGILTFAFADYPTLKECQQHEPIPNFNSTSFLKGTWFVTNAKHGSNSTVCRRYKTRLKEGIVKLNGDGYYNFKKQTFFKVRCEGQKSRHNGGKFTLQCKQTAQGYDITINLELEITVLETDYSNFAVMYRCAKIPHESATLFEDNLLVLHRKPTITNGQDSRITETLKKHNLCLAHFISRKGVVCPVPPNVNKRKN